ncbi:MAG: FAD-dependent oxidoreductase [Actinomycetota bacterium]
METDVAILGGGAAGLSAAREARRQGATATIVNRGPLGGDCTFTGCVPSKTVIEAAKAGLGFTEAFTRARSVVAHIAATESADRLREEGIEVIDDEGTLTAVGRAPALQVGTRTITAAGVVLALGSRPFVPPIPGLDRVRFLTTDSLWELDRAPATMVVIGGGPIGVELSQALARLGVGVTLVEMAPSILTREESAAVDLATRALEGDGVTVLTGASVSQVEPAAGETAAAAASAATVVLADGRRVVADRILVAAGRQPNSHRGGLAEAGVALDERGSVTNRDSLQTSVSGVYVAGDLAGRLQFTHAADHMGRIAAANIVSRFGRIRPQRFVAGHVPWVTFTDPEIARIGHTEAEAARLVPGAQVAELPLAEHDRALAADAIDGFIKIIAAPRPVLGMTGGGRIVGATIVSERAGEMMAEIALAVRLGAFTGRLAQSVHAYPTWSYGVAKAVGQFFTTIEGRTARPAREETVAVPG